MSNLLSITGRISKYILPVILVFSLLIISFSSLAASPPPPSTVPVTTTTTATATTTTVPATGSISGHVYKADNITPLSEATVIVSGYIGGSLISRQGYSENDGRYLVTGIPFGGFQVACQMEGYVAQYYDHRYQDNSADQVRVDSTETVSGIDFSMEEGGRIAGFVFAEDGETPVSPAMVYIQRMDGDYDFGNSTGTNPDGSYIVSAVPAGNYLLWASCSDRYSEFYKDVINPDLATLVSVTVNKTTSGINFTLDKGGSISGHVYEADGKTPIIDAGVSAERIIDSDFRYDFSIGSQTEADGSYSLKNVPPGNYLVHAGGGVYLTEYFKNVNEHDYRQADLIPVVSPVATSNIDFTLDFDPGQVGSISGYVFKLDGETPLSGASVEARSINDEDYIKWVKVADDGSYCLPNLLPGHYLVSANRTGYISQFYHNAYGTSTAAPVPVNASAVTFNISFALDPGGLITGHVYKADGNTPVSGAEVRAYRADGDFNYSAGELSTADGSYTIGTFPAGSYYVRVACPGYCTVYYIESPDTKHAVKVPVASSDCTTGINFTLAPSGTISGHIYKADGKTPIADAVVCALPVAPNQDTVRTYSDIHGRYYFGDLPDGKYRICAESPGYIREFYEDCVNADLASQIEVDSLKGATGINLNLNPGGSISGFVYESDGITPISGADVIATLVGVDYAFGVGVKSAVDGSFFISGLASGQYQVYAVKEGFTLEFYNGTYDSKKYTPVRVTAPRTTGPFTFELDSGGAISGFIYEADGKTPVPGASINCGRLDDDFGYGVSALSGNDGSYVISGLPPGSYRIEVSKEGYFTEYYDNAVDIDQAKPVPVIEKETTSGISFAIERRGSISGHIYHSDGKTPATDTHVAVQLVNEYTWVQAKTDSSGSYFFGDLHPGKYQVSVTGYNAIYYNNVCSPIFATLIDINGDNETGIDLKLDDGVLGSISGHIDPHPEECGRHWLISAYDASTNEVVGVDHLDGSGDYRVQCLPPGKYLVRVSDNGGLQDYEGPVHYYIAQWYGEKYYPDQSTPVTVKIEQETPNIDFTMKTGATISGHISVPAGTSSDRQVSVFGYDDNNWYATKPFSGSDYTIGGLPDGRYKVRITAKGIAAQWYNNAPHRQTAEAVTISDGGSVTGIDFQLSGDTTPPAVVSTSPATSATGVPIDSSIRIEFSEDMYAEAVFKSFNISPPVVGKLEIIDDILTLKPAQPLAYKTTYTVTMLKSTFDYAQNLIGALFTFSFTTEAKKSFGSPGGSARGSSGGGGGSSSPPVNHTLTLSGLNSASPLAVNGLSYAVAPASLTSADGKLSISVSQGTSLKSANGSLLSSVSAQPASLLPDPEGQAVILGYNLGPEGAQFSPALALAFFYNGISLPQGVSEDDLYLAFWDGSQWAKLQAKLDPAAKTLTADVSHFSTYALLAVLPPPPATDAAPAPSLPPVSPSPAGPEASIPVQSQAANPVTASGNNTSVPPSGAVAEVQTSVSVTTSTIASIPASAVAAAPFIPDATPPSSELEKAPSDYPMLWMTILVVVLILVIILAFIVRRVRSGQKRQ